MGSQIIQASAYGFYIVHGSIISDPPVVLLGITSLSQSLVLIGQYFYFKGTYEENDGRTKKDMEEGDKYEVVEQRV